MNQHKQRPRYFSCLLRVWQTEDGEQNVWRASLEFPNGERLGFASLDDLFVYLICETGADGNLRMKNGVSRAN